MYCFVQCTQKNPLSVFDIADETGYNSTINYKPTVITVTKSKSYKFLITESLKEINNMDNQNKNRSGLKKAIAVAIMSAVCITAAVSVTSMTKTVKVTDGDKTTSVSTINSDTDTIIEKSGIVLGENDKIVRTDDSENGTTLSILRGVEVESSNKDKLAVKEAAVSESFLTAGMKLSESEAVSLASAVEAAEKEIKLSKKNITVDVRGNVIEKEVPAGKVKDALAYLDIKLGANDIIGTDLNTELSDGMKIVIKNVKYKTNETVEAVDYKVVYKDTDALYKGESEVETEGVEGERKIVSKEKYVNDVLESTELVSDEITKAPVNKVVLNGTKEKASAPAPVYQDYTEGYIYPYLTNTMGRNLNGPSGQETYYNMDMSGIVSSLQRGGWMYNQCVDTDLIDYILDTKGYWVREDGCKMFGDYIMVAAGLDVRPRGSLVQTSLGMGIVVDTGGFAYNDPYQLDIATTW